MCKASFTPGVREKCTSQKRRENPKFSPLAEGRFLAVLLPFFWETEHLFVFRLPSSVHCPADRFCPPLEGSLVPGAFSPRCCLPNLERRAGEIIAISSLDCGPRNRTPIPCHSPWILQISFSAPRLSKKCIQSTGSAPRLQWDDFPDFAPTRGENRHFRRAKDLENVGTRHRPGTTKASDVCYFQAPVRPP